MWPFKKNDKIDKRKDQKKCDGCRKIKNSSEITKVEDDKYLCEECAK